MASAGKLVDLIASSSDRIKKLYGKRVGDTLEEMQKKECDRVREKSELAQAVLHRRQGKKT